MVGGRMVRRGGAALAVCILVGFLISVPAACLAYPVFFALSPRWNLWSLTLIPANPDPAVVFDGMPLDHRLYRWDAAAQEYVPYRDDDPAGFGPLVIGQGYWVFSDYYRGDMSYEYVGLPDEPWLDLPHTGWHLVGSPVYEHRINQMTVADMLTSASVPIDEAGALGWLDPVLWKYIPPYGYRFVDVWDAGHGAWLLTHRPDLRLELPIAPVWPYPWPFPP